ncbi:dienelactone hydrolase family protein [Erythrobacter sp. 3-20A1M]|uniref:dienelactone hydrolase family protein n=1 Tax=Erythrobacter sp. 3-20A1M TaxID=2653850 RepID=UPI001BFC63AA|nr:dienelactone hydrolase family protein [Erythrobacter sp. 3-20A1M]QWC57247.1 dienelactone hydrolase family protein [Erythrobacter sp. 3-20A1M]
MCDQTDLARLKGLDRRRFGAGSMALGGTAALAACTGMNDRSGGDGESTAAGGSDGLTRSNVTIDTPHGKADAFFVHPASGNHPAVLLWPDIAGLREAFYRMSARLAGEGYAVLAVNPYYRDVSGEQFADFSAFAGDNGFEKVGPWREKLTADNIMRDASAYIAWLDRQDAVDTGRGAGTQGYCMGGPFTVWSAAAVPERIRAAASFHGGGLVRDGAKSPHNMLGRTQASYLFAVAQNDDAKDPEAKTTLREAAAAANVPAEIEVYPADHGWTVIDSPSYDKSAAEKAWSRLMALYGGTIASD